MVNEVDYHCHTSLAKTEDKLSPGAVNPAQKDQSENLIQQPKIESTEAMDDTKLATLSKTASNSSTTCL